MTFVFVSARIIASRKEIPLQCCTCTSKSLCQCNFELERFFSHTFTHTRGYHERGGFVNAVADLPSVSSLCVPAIPPPP